MTALLALGLTAGCYRYVPIAPTAARPDEEVRVRVSDAAAARLARELGAYTNELEGQIARESPESLSVSVTIARDYRGLSLESARQELFLGPSEVVEVRRRELSRARTALVTVGALTAFGLIAGAVAQHDDPNPNDQTPPPPPPPSGFALRFRVLLP
jgi:hypothetical protein